MYWGNLSPSASDPALAERLQELGREGGDLASFAGGEADTAEAALATKGVEEHGKTVVVLGKIRRVDLVTIAAEHDLRPFTDAGEKRLDGARFEVLRFVDDDEA